MTRRYTKEDVEQHSDGYGRGSRPAVNVKVSFPYDWTKLARTVATNNGDPTDAEAFAQYVDEHSDPFNAAEDLPAWLFEAACESGWEMLQSDAEEILGAHVKVWSEGRSGGWAVVDGLPDLEDWDAIQLSKWRKFERYARMVADDIPYQMLTLLLFNVWEPEQERRRECEQTWTNDLLHALRIA